MGTVDISSWDCQSTALLDVAGIFQLPFAQLDPSCHLQLRKLELGCNLLCSWVSVAVRIELFIILVTSLFSVVEDAQGTAL